MTEPFADRYQLLNEVARLWDDHMAQQFPDADHRGCRQEMRLVIDRWMPYHPARCAGYHCPHCGAATGGYGHTNCEATT